jgi:hypothetical protein
MGIFSKAHKSLAAEVARLEGLKELHDEIKRAGSMEKLVGEVDAERVQAEQKLAVVNVGIRTAGETLAGLQRQAEQQREQNIKLISEAKEAASSWAKAGKVTADDIKREADQVLAAAGVERDRLIAEGRAIKAALDMDAAEVAEAIKVARQELATTQARKADVEGEIARLKSLFGGRV